MFGAAFTTALVGTAIYASNRPNEGITNQDIFVEAISAQDTTVKSTRGSCYSLVQGHLVTSLDTMRCVDIDGYTGYGELFTF